MQFQKLEQLNDARSTIRGHYFKKYGTRNLSDITSIAIHHSATMEGSADAFARYHVSKGWPGIGYAFVISKNGRIDWCNDLESITYHVGNSNFGALGICLVGWFPKQQPTKEQWKSLYDLIKALMADLKITANKVMGHQEYPGYSWKPCPGLDMDGIRAALKKKNQTAKQSQPNPEIYVIQDGDTLWQLAHNHDGLTVDDLVEMNPHINPMKLRIGQEIYFKRTQKIPFPGQLIKKGDRGEMIKLIQKKVGTAQDGIYGALTERAVMQYQKKYGLDVDGVVGPKTWAHMFE